MQSITPFVATPKLDPLFGGGRRRQLRQTLEGGLEGYAFTEKGQTTFDEAYFSVITLVDAIKNRNWRVVEVILNQGKGRFDPNTLTEGVTPLIAFVDMLTKSKFSDEEALATVQKFVALGSAIYIPDDTGRTALDYFDPNRISDAQQRLEKYPKTYAYLLQRSLEEPKFGPDGKIIDTVS